MHLYLHSYTRHESSHVPSPPVRTPCRNREAAHRWRRRDRTAAVELGVRDALGLLEPGLRVRLEYRRHERGRAVRDRRVERLRENAVLEIGERRAACERESGVAENAGGWARLHERDGDADDDQRLVRRHIGCRGKVLQ
jgi:hypothetical protein